jgi:hypothetical protein
MVLIWGGWSVGLFGWCLLRDYDVTLGQLVSPTHPYHGTWPPAKIPPGQIWPGGTSGSQTAAGNVGGAINQGVNEITANLPVKGAK